MMHAQGIKSTYSQKERHLCETSIKFDTLMYKPHNKVTLVLRYQGLETLDP